MTLDPDVKLEIGYSDIGYRVTITNRAFIKRTLPRTYIRTITTLLEVIGIGKDKYKTAKYIITPLFLLGRNKLGYKVIIKTAPREIYLVDDLRAKILIRIDVMTPKGIDICKAVVRYIRLRPATRG